MVLAMFACSPIFPYNQYALRYSYNNHEKIIKDTKINITIYAFVKKNIPDQEKNEKPYRHTHKVQQQQHEPKLKAKDKQ